MALPGADGQNAAVFVSITDSVSGMPAVPAVNRIWLVPCPLVIVPFPSVQVYVDPGLGRTLAVRFGDPAPTVAGAEITGAGRSGSTVTAALPVDEPGPFASETAATVYVVVVAGLTLRVAGLVRTPVCAMASDHVIDHGGVPVSTAWMIVELPTQIVAIPVTVAVEGT
jgi:hypothetical protein